MSLLSPMSPPIVLPDASGQPLDMIALTGMKVDCLIGLYPTERNVPQPLNLDVWLFLDTRHAAHSGSLRYSVDYARLAGELRFLLESCQFLLLETAADALCHYLLAPGTDDAPRAPLKAVALRLIKPKALESVVQPALTVWRRAEEVTVKREPRSYGQVEILYQTKGCGIYRVRVAPGKHYVVNDGGHGVEPPGLNGSAHADPGQLRRELTLGDGLCVAEQPLSPGMVVQGPSNALRLYGHRQASLGVEGPALAARMSNGEAGESAHWQSLLCVHRPATVPEEQPELTESQLRELKARGNDFRLEGYYPPEDHTPRDHALA